MKNIILILSILITSYSLSISSEKEFFLFSPSEHSKFIRNAIQTAQDRIVIVSPFISEHRLKNTQYNQFDGLIGYIKSAIQRGVKVYVYTDKELDITEDKTGNKFLKTYANNGREMLSSAGAKLKIVERIHTKNIFIDETCSTVGSFNWLSAETNPGSTYCRFETTSILYGDQAKHIRCTVMAELIDLEMKEYRSDESYFSPSISVVDGMIDCIARLNEESSQHHFRAENLLEKVVRNLDDSQCKDIIDDLYYGRNPKPKNLIVFMIEHLMNWGFTVNTIQVVDFIEILTDIKEKSAAKKLLKRLFRCDRGREFDNLDYIWGRLDRMGMPNVANMFEAYMHGFKYKDHPYVSLEAAMSELKIT